MVRVPSKFGDKNATISDVVDRVTKENEIEYETSSKFVIITINANKETQAADRRQDYSMDRDPLISIMIL